MDLIQAINNVEAAATTLKSADDTQAAAVAKFEAAKTAKEAADQADNDATLAFNSSLNDLITAAKAAMRPVAQ